MKAHLIITLLAIALSLSAIIVAKKGSEAMSQEKGNCPCMEAKKSVDIDSAETHNGKDTAMHYFDKNTGLSWILDVKTRDTIAFAGCHGTMWNRDWHLHDTIAYFSIQK